MLARVGIESVDELLTAVPKDARGPAMGVPPGLSEAEIQVHMEQIAALDRTAGSGPFFIGGPVQRRYIPAAVPVLALRGEFLTAYTPYQAELAQGRLELRQIARPRGGQHIIDVAPRHAPIVPHQ